MKHDVTNRQLFLLGGVGAVCAVVIAVVGAVVVELANLIVTGKSIVEKEV